MNANAIPAITRIRLNSIFPELLLNNQNKDVLLVILNQFRQQNNRRRTTTASITTELMFLANNDVFPQHINDAVMRMMNARIEGEGLTDTEDYVGGRKGGYLKPSSLSKFIKASYSKKKDVPEVNGYKLDKSISSKRSKVYVDPEGKAVVTHAGTDSASDWLNNLLIPIPSLYRRTDRYKRAEDVQQKALAKYKDVETVGHSQSGNIVNELTKKGLTKKGKTQALNPALLNPFDSHKGVKVIRSSGDVVSALTRKGKDDITIPAKSFNPLKEHSPDILGELGGMRYRKNKPIMMMYNDV